MSKSRSKDTTGGTITLSGEVCDLNDAVMHWDGGNIVAHNSPSPSQADFKKLEEEFKYFRRAMEERLAAIEDQVVLVKRDAILEHDFKELEEAWEAYNTLLEKLKTFKALQDSA